MANICMVLGKSSTGKSSSIRNLDPKSTIIINPLGKKLPFKGASKMYNAENKNFFQLEKHSDIINLLNNINTSAPHVKTIILDDFIYCMRKEYFARAKESGYSKYTELAMHFQQIVSTCEKMRDDINIFMILHSEDIKSDNTITGYKVSTIGSLIDNQYNPIEVVPIVLYSDVLFNDKGEATYGFYTKRCMKGTIEVPAKTPAELFSEDFIENDLQKVIEAMNEYY